MATYGPRDVSRSASTSSSRRRREAEEAAAAADALYNSGGAGVARPVKRTPSRLHRQVIQAEVAVPEAGLGQITNSPVTLLSVKRTSAPDSEFFLQDLKRYPYANKSVEYSWFLANCRHYSMENGGVSVVEGNEGTGGVPVAVETQPQDAALHQQQEDAPSPAPLSTATDAANEMPVESLPTKTVVVTSDQISVENTTTSAEPGVENNVQDGQEILGGTSQQSEEVVVVEETTTIAAPSQEVKGKGHMERNMFLVGLLLHFLSFLVFLFLSPR